MKRSLLLFAFAPVLAVAIAWLRPQFTLTKLEYGPPHPAWMLDWYGPSDRRPTHPQWYCTFDPEDPMPKYLGRSWYCEHTGTWLP